MHPSETRQQFPKMIYQGGVPSGEDGKFRVVDNADELEAAKADGFTEYDMQAKQRAKDEAADKAAKAEQKAKK